ncbi:MAG: HAD-IIIA family hydrolase [Proteobacteria bacterium]|nr:HAD-IIIA family hydrolase [Pseudomonadota bacterium]
MDIEKVRKIKLLVLDVDGVLTDGSVVYSDSGEELKLFNVKDGHGIKLLMRAGIEVAFITGRSSQALERRAQDLGVRIVFQKALQKIEAYEEILKIKNLRDEEICVVGDDLPDLPILRRCGFSVGVADSVEEVKREVDYVTIKEAGKGAVREVCEIILKATGRWEAITARYF